MKIACVQFHPQDDGVEANIKLANTLISEIESVDFMVFPRRTFYPTYYDRFERVGEMLDEEYQRDMEMTIRWTMEMAKSQCRVITGFRELSSSGLDNLSDTVIACDSTGVVTSVKEMGFVKIPNDADEQKLKVIIGIGTDMLHDAFPLKIIEAKATLVIISEVPKNTIAPSHADINPRYAMLAHWLSMYFKQVIRAKKDYEIIVIFSNHSWSTRYSPFVGTSSVVGITNGMVYIYGALESNARGVLVVDTEHPCEQLLHDGRTIELNYDGGFFNCPPTTAENAPKPPVNRSPSSGPSDRSLEIIAVQSIWPAGKKDGYLGNVPRDAPGTPLQRPKSPKDSRFLNSHVGIE